MQGGIIETHMQARTRWNNKTNKSWGNSSIKKNDHMTDQEDEINKSCMIVIKNQEVPLANQLTN